MVLEYVLFFELHSLAYKKDMELLNNIQAFFQGIGFRISTQNNLSSLDDLQVIIAHFYKYPLKKPADFELFKRVVNKL